MECCWGRRAEHDFSGGGTLDAAHLGVIGWDGETPPWLPSVCSFQTERREGKQVLNLLCKVSTRLRNTVHG